MSNLHQLSLALTIYQDDHDGRSPAWLSNLYPDYLNSQEIYICKEDRSIGTDGSKPEKGDVGDRYPETSDVASNNHPDRNRAIEACSYLYEFCGERCSWDYNNYLNASDADIDLDGNNAITWGEVKKYQMEHGDSSAASNFKPYAQTRFPIVRCFFHWHNRQVPAVQYDNTGKATGVEADYLTLNVAYAGNVFEAPLNWESTVTSE